MNTPSDKSDGFLEHVAQRQRYVPLARSRPGTLKNIPSGVYVPIDHKAAPASMHTNGQGLGYLCAAYRAELACVVRGHLNYFTTGSFSLVSEHGDEARPSYVGNRSGKSVVLNHPLDVQAFDSNLAVARNQIIRNLVLVFSPKVCHTSVNFSEPALGLPPVQSTFLLSGKRTLRSAKLRKFFFEISGVLDLFSSGGSRDRQADFWTIHSRTTRFGPGNYSENLKPHERRISLPVVDVGMGTECSVCVATVVCRLVDFLCVQKL